MTGMHKENLGGCPTALQALQRFDENHQLHLRTQGDKKDSGPSRLIRRNKAEVRESAALFTNCGDNY